jgi:glyoxylase-like metal-dependent hydrolase (beta-lactamase superfamily II)
MATDITPFYEPESGTWSYLVADLSGGKAAIIDPVWVFDPVSGMADSAFIDRILETAADKGLTIEWVLETHAHADHLTAADQIRQRTGAGIACGRGVCSVQENFARVFDFKDMATDGSQFDRLLSEADIITLGASEIRVMETPGHTNDSVTYLVDDAAFIGDTLFAPSFGTARCDFPGGSAAHLYDSIGRIHALAPETRLFLCHDYPKSDEQAICQVSVAESLSENIHIKAGTAREDYIAMREGRDRQLGLPRLILPSLQVNILAGAAPPEEASGVSYLRTPFNKSLASLIADRE